MIMSWAFVGFWTNWHDSQNWGMGRGPFPIFCFFILLLFFSQILYHCCPPSTHPLHSHRLSSPEHWDPLSFFSGFVFFFFSGETTSWEREREAFHFTLNVFTFKPNTSSYNKLACKSCITWLCYAFKVDYMLRNC